MEIRARYVLIGLFTLAVIAAGFGFVYWLNAFGGWSEKPVYLVRFEGSVTGLLVGGPVLFNGIRVGEVTALRLEPDNPKQVVATIAVDPGTRVHADTQVGLEQQGLLSGSPAITLTGGSPSSPLIVARKGEAPILVAEAGAGQSMTQAAREALRRLDAILADNSQSLHSTIENLKTFTDALARNSDRVDGILASLEKMTGGSSRPSPGYDLMAVSTFPAIEKTPKGQLVVNDPTAVVAFETQKILVRQASGERGPMDNAQWSDSIPKLIQARMIQSFENAKYLRVGRPTDGITADFQLLIDIRSFQVVMSPEPGVDVEFGAKILGEGGRIVDARIFHATAPVAKLEPVPAVASFNQAFGNATTDLVMWAVGLI